VWVTSRSSDRPWYGYQAIEASAAMRAASCAFGNPRPRGTEDTCGRRAARTPTDPGPGSAGAGARPVHFRQHLIHSVTVERREDTTVEHHAVNGCSAGIPTINSASTSRIGDVARGDLDSRPPTGSVRPPTPPRLRPERHGGRPAAHAYRGSQPSASSSSRWTSHQGSKAAHQCIKQKLCATEQRIPSDHCPFGAVVRWRTRGGAGLRLALCPQLVTELPGRITRVNDGVVLAVVLSAGVLLVALVVATAMVLRAVRGSTATRLQNPGLSSHRVDDSTVRFEAVLGQARDIVTRFERSIHLLADLQPTIAQNLPRRAEPGISSGPAEVSDSRIVAELNHALQTPLRGLSYAIRNMEDLPDRVVIEERAKRLADMTAMLDSCTSALATFRGLVDTVASVPARQPSLNEAIRAFSASIPHPSGESVRIDFVGLPDRVDRFSNHYLLTTLQPLVENAIEGCVPGGTVEITFADHGDAVEFTVFNPVDHPVDKEILFAPRRTTKDRHQGLGVSIVQRLAEFERGDLTADITDTGVRMRVVLPRR